MGLYFGRALDYNDLQQLFQLMSFLFFTVSIENHQFSIRIKRSDSAAFKSVFELYQEGLFNFLNYKLGETAVAEDIMQEVFVKLWENRHSLKEDLSLKSYLYTIANNLALNHIRHNKVVLQFQQEETQQERDYSTPQDHLEESEFHANLLGAIEKLPEQNRIVFMMSRFEEFSYKEIAERLGISVKTVESHIGKALKTLRKSLQKIM